MTERKDIKNYILKKYIQKQRDLMEDALNAYGTVITKNGKILTVREMESLTFIKKVRGYENI